MFCSKKNELFNRLILAYFRKRTQKCSLSRQVNYDTEISISPLLSRSEWLQEKGMRPSNTAIIHMYYKENSFRSQRKEELVGFTEFLCMFPTFESTSEILT